METHLASPAQVARALGVCATTVKTWVDRGILPACRTAGGHRRIPVEDVLRLARSGDFPNQDLALLPGGCRGLRCCAQALRTLIPALRKGDEPAVRDVLTQALQAGMPLTELADDVVRPALGYLGTCWQEGKLGVHQEHRAVNLCLAALYGVRQGLLGPAPRRPLRRPRAVGATPAGDPYRVAGLLAEMVLLDEGWEVVNLGPDTPLASLSEAVAEVRPRLAWLSVSSLASEQEFTAAFAALARDCQHQGVALVVGGRALTEAVRSALPYTTYGDRLGHLAAFARTLCPRPCRPRRGRPSKV